MRLTLPLLLLLASPVWAQPVCSDGQPPTVTRPQHGEIRVTCGGHRVGVREHPDGTREALKYERSLLRLGKKVWKATPVRSEDFPRELDPLLPPGDAPVSAPAALDVAGTVVQRVLVVWTPRVEAEVGGPDAALALAVLGVAISNNTYTNSKVPIRLELAAGRRIAHVETNISSDLTKLQQRAVVDRNGVVDTALDQVHVWRDEFLADLVLLLGSGYASAGACGLGFLCSGPTTAFTVVDRTCVAGRYSFTHELGHNQCAHHDPITVCGASTCPGYAFGRQFGGLGTVMSYNGSRVQYLSSPLVIHPSNNLPTGIADRQDNARTLRGSAATVAAFRDTPPSTGLTAGGPPTPKGI